MVFVRCEIALTLPGIRRLVHSIRVGPVVGPSILCLRRGRRPAGFLPGAPFPGRGDGDH